MRLKRWILILWGIVCLNGAIEAQPVTLVLDHISNNKDQGSPIIDNSRNSFSVTEKYNNNTGHGTVAITVALGSAKFTSGVLGSAPGAGPCETTKFPESPKPLARRTLGVVDGCGASRKPIVFGHKERHVTKLRTMVFEELERRNYSKAMAISGRVLPADRTEDEPDNRVRHRDLPGDPMGGDECRL